MTELQLRKYQIEDVLKLCKLDAAGVFSEQRTGKTPIAVSVVHKWKANKVLIVCPKSAMVVWRQEYTRWTKGRPAYVVTGTYNQKEKIINAWTRGALIINYDSLKTTKTSKGFIDLILKKQPDALICDEAHRFKTYNTAIYKAVDKLLKIPKRLTLTGTPTSGKPEDIFAQLHFINPKQFGSYWSFINNYAIVKTQYAYNRTYQEIVGLKKDAIKQIQLFLDKNAVQRKRKDIMAWLPAKEYVPLKLTPSAEQIKYLDELTKYFETEDVVTKGILDRLIRYRQICLDPGILRLKGTSPKTDWVISFFKDNPEEPTLLFSKFTTYITLLSKLLNDENISHKIITGATPVEERAEVVAGFQRGVYKVLLLNIDAAKEALTLDKATTAIFTDLFPPVSDIQQAEDRFVATQKEIANKGHTVYQLLLKDTYDEQIYKLLKQKATIADLFNDYKKYITGNSLYK